MPRPLLIGLSADSIAFHPLDSGPRDVRGDGCDNQIAEDELIDVVADSQQCRDDAGTDGHPKPSAAECITPRC